MILIADSGSTKTDWCIVFNDTPIKRMGTKGINPFFQSEEEIQQELTHSLLPQLPEGTINSVFFYGAGCTPEKAPVLRRAIADSLPVIRNIKASNIRVYFSVQNLFTATEFTGFDVESSDNTNPYPNARSFIGGISLNF